jgi:hypothetical protein
MPRWVWLVLLLGLGVYGWMRTSALRERGAHELVAVNRTGRLVEGLTIRVGGKRVEVAALAPGATAKRPLLCDRDGAFELAWLPEGSDHELAWRGGRFTRGPLPMRHRFELVRGDGVVWRSERIRAASPSTKRESARKSKR